MRISSPILWKWGASNLGWGGLSLGAQGQDSPWYPGQGLGLQHNNHPRE